VSSFFFPSLNSTFFLFLFLSSMINSFHAFIVCVF
jgi:hypothetical protein